MTPGKVYKNLLRGTCTFPLHGKGDHYQEILNENDVFIYLGETTNECPKILYKGKVYYVLPYRVIRVFEVM